MKKIALIFMSIIAVALNTKAQSCVSLGATPSTDQNYIITYQPRIAGIKNAADLPSKNVCEVMQEIKYFDGFNRLEQTVRTKASPDATKDLVLFKYYDPYGRDAFKLPVFASPTGDGSHKFDPWYEQAMFYGYPPESIEATWSAFGEIMFDHSPLNIVREQGEPGDAFALLVSGNDDAGHTVNTDYAYNTATGDHAVRIFEAVASTVSGSEHERTLSSPGYYAANEVFINITKDENWQSGKKGTVEEYKDKDGRLILKRLWKDNSTPISTYYVYDWMNNISFVLTSEANPDSGVPSSTVLDHLCYQYRYDAKQRIIEKKVPGKAWQYLVYNKFGKLVATQEGEQRARNEWTISRYDKQGRIIITALWTNNNVAISRASIQSSVLAAINWDVKDNSQTNGYYLQAYPTNLNTILTVNYYDDYDIVNFPSSYVRTAVDMTNGLLTATKTAVINNPSHMLWSVNYYDEFGRSKKVINQHYKGAAVVEGNFDEITNNYTFTNDIESSNRIHKVAGTTQVDILRSYNYDHMGRKIKSWETINSGTPTLISKIDYNEIGQVLNKSLHSTNSGTTFLETMKYAYNTRGWLKQINDPDNITAGKDFAMKFIYNTNSDYSKNQYNGNLSEIVWQSTVPAGLGFTQEKQSYLYSYDALDRVTLAKYTTYGKTDYFNESITYSSLGNINNLERTASGSIIDQLSYVYENSGQSNRLASLTDNSASNDGQPIGTASYTYDTNGNLITDNIKTLTYTYNYLNLPQSITKSSTSEVVTYIYDANGKKLRKEKTGDNREYIDGIEYDQSGNLESFTTEEGRAVKNGSAYSYEYNLKDHLGNVRVVVKDDGSILQSLDYYAFGMEIAHNSVVSSPENLTHFGGKELQKNLDLKQLDFGARFYDPTIARWMVIDPLAEKEHNKSPYIYTNNNPVKNIDKNGMETLTGDAAREFFEKFKSAIGRTDEEQPDDIHFVDQRGNLLATFHDGKKEVKVVVLPIKNIGFSPNLNLNSKSFKIKDIDVIGLSLSFSATDGIGGTAGTDFAFFLDGKDKNQLFAYAFAGPTVGAGGSGLSLSGFSADYLKDDKTLNAKTYLGIFNFGTAVTPVGGVTYFWGNEKGWAEPAPGFYGLFDSKNTQNWSGYALSAPGPNLNLSGGFANYIFIPEVNKLLQKAGLQKK